MFFKNLIVYKFVEEIPTALQLREALHSIPFLPCRAHSLFSFGFVSPSEFASEIIFHETETHILFAARKEEKLLPASVVNNKLAEKVDEIEEAKDRKIGSKERNQMKEEIFIDLLPKAFTKASNIYAMIDKKGLLIINSASTKKAEDFLSLLRNALGGLSVRPLTATRTPIAVMTSALRAGDPLYGFSFDDEVEFRSPDEKPEIVRSKRIDVTADELAIHLENYKDVYRMAMTYANKISFILDHDLTFKRLVFLDVASEADDEQELWQADFLIASAGISELINATIKAINDF